MNIDRGPWLNPTCYVMSIAYREMAWIKDYAAPKATDDFPSVTEAQNTPESHLNLLEKYLQVAPHLMNIEKRLNRATLWHRDLHSSNLFADNNCITAVIDWQGVWAGPLFLQAEPSQLVNYPGSIMLKRPDNFEELDDEQKTKIKQQIARSTFFQLYLMETEDRNPILAEVFHLDHGKTRRLPVEFAGNTWDDDIVSFREALINIERNWKELGIECSCPIHFTKDELQCHLRDADGWNEVQDFFDGIDGLVKRDGWTHNDTFDDALRFFSDLRKVGLRNMKGKEREKFENETRWAKR